MPAFPCRACGAPLTIDEPIPRDAECPGCGADVRACVNCRHYDPRLHNACRETEAEQVEDRHRRNFCEFFLPNREPYAASGQSGRASDAREKLNRLFGDAPGKPASPGTARERLEGLFKKKPPED